jgi:ubiquitin C-terminal hydrolase
MHFSVSMQQITRILDITVEYARYTPTKFWQHNAISLSQTTYFNYNLAVCASGSRTARHYTSIVTYLWNYVYNTCFPMCTVTEKINVIERSPS